MTQSARFNIEYEISVDDCEENAKKSNLGFVALAATLHRHFTEDGSLYDEFPLRKKILLRSNMSLVRSDADVSSYMVEGNSAVLYLNLLTLAGINGVLPYRITEEIRISKKRGGDSLHNFFDLLNRRFWELFFESYRIGTRPHYGFNHLAARTSVQRMAADCVGLKNTADISDIKIEKQQDALLTRFCFQLGNGGGTYRTLSELLEKSVGVPVYVRPCRDVKVALPERYRATIGRLEKKPLLGQSSILGSQAQVLESIEMVLILTESRLPDFIPINGSKKVHVLLNSLSAALKERSKNVSLECRVSNSRVEQSKLGKHDCRLSWGASLKSGVPSCRVIRVSNTALAAMKDVA